MYILHQILCLEIDEDQSRINSKSVCERLKYVFDLLCCYCVKRWNKLYTIKATIHTKVEKLTLKLLQNLKWKYLKQSIMLRTKPAILYSFMFIQRRLVKIDRFFCPCLNFWPLIIAVLTLATLSDNPLAYVWPPLKNH